MKRRWKILIGVVLVLLLVLGLNAIALNGQTKDAQTTVDGGQLVDTFGGTVQVTDSGNPQGSPIVLLHCYACSLRWWDGILPLLERDHRVIRIDLLGHGGSEKPTNGYSIANQAATVASALSSLGVDRATVVGHSLGFDVATGLAESSPELVAKLVDIDEAPDTSYGDEPLLGKLVHVPLLGQAIYRGTPDVAIRDSVRVAFAPGYNLASGFENPDQVVVDVRAMTYPSLTKSSDGYEDYVGEKPLDERLAALKAPVPLLVIFGSEDQLYNDPQAAADAYKDVPGAAVSIVPGAGHSPNVEKPAGTAALILEFAANPGDEGVPGAQEFVPPNKQKLPRAKKPAGKKGKGKKG
jgi:pimeloyl-ACP methyl ester carboxylesterase